VTGLTCISNNRGGLNDWGLGLLPEGTRQNQEDDFFVCWGGETRSLSGSFWEKSWRSSFNPQGRLGGAHPPQGGAGGFPAFLHGPRGSGSPVAERKKEHRPFARPMHTRGGQQFQD